MVYFQIQKSWLIREVMGTENKECQDVRHENKTGSHYADLTIVCGYLYVKVPIPNTGNIKE